VSNIVAIISKQKAFRQRTPVEIETINIVEQKLNVRFSIEYKEYLLAFGEASIYGHELTGICESKRLNVVDVTIEERERDENIPDDFYVIEQTHTDDIVIWQSGTGEIYKSQPNCNYIKICDSLCRYIEKYN